MSHPDELPDLFLDRGLGRIQVPRLLRDAGLRLVTLAEHYGVPADEVVSDVEWLELAGRNDWEARGLLRSDHLTGGVAEGRSAVVRPAGAAGPA